MREKMRRFMDGRYGNDNLSSFLLICAMACIALFMILRLSFLYIICIALLVYAYYRILSRNTTRRSFENMKYVSIRNKFLGIFIPRFRTDGYDRAYRVFMCPGCGQKVRVPRGHGRIAITCPKCKMQFVKRT